MASMVRSFVALAQHGHVFIVSFDGNVGGMQKKKTASAKLYLVVQNLLSDGRDLFCVFATATDDVGAVLERAAERDDVSGGGTGVRNCGKEGRSRHLPDGISILPFPSLSPSPSSRLSFGAIERDLLYCFCKLK